MEVQDYWVTRWGNGNCRAIKFDNGWVVKCLASGKGRMASAQCCPDAPRDVIIEAAQNAIKELEQKGRYRAKGILHIFEDKHIAICIRSR